MQPIPPVGREGGRLRNEGVCKGTTIGHEGKRRGWPHSTGQPVPCIPSPMHPLSHCTDMLLPPQASCSGSICLPSTAPSLPSTSLAWLCPLSIPSSFPARLPHSGTPLPSSPPSSSIPKAPFQTSFSPGFSVPSSPSPALAQPGGLLPLPMPPQVPTPPPAPELQALAPGEEQVQRGEGCTHHCQPGSASGGLQGEQSRVRGVRTTHYRAPPTSPPGPAHSPSSVRAAMP